MSCGITDVISQLFLEVNYAYVMPLNNKYEKTPLGILTGYVRVTFLFDLNLELSVG